MCKRIGGLPAYVAAAVALAVGAIASPAWAVTKDFSAFGWMAELDPGLDLTVLNSTGSTVTLALEKNAIFTSTNPLNILFRQTADTSVTQIVIADETIVNDSGSSWTGFRFSISGGMSNNGALPSFDTAASGSFGDGTQLPTETFTGDRQLDLTGGSVPSGVFPGNLFSPGGSGDLVINAAPFSSGGLRQTFTFTEAPNPGGPGPVIPLPAAALPTLMTLGGLGLVSAKRFGKSAS